jgi:hypothetical protein
MSITTYLELQTAVGNWLHRTTGSGIATARVQEFIAQAEDYIAHDLRIRAMEASSDLTVDDQEVALPTRFLGVRRIYISGTPNSKLDFLPSPAFWEKHLSTQTSKPKGFTIEGDNLVFGPAPDDSYTGKLLFWQRFATLSDDADTNWVLTNARGLLLYRAMVEAAAYLENDAMALKYAALYEDIKDVVEKGDRNDRFPAGQLTMRSDVAVG